ncbi:glycosyltransferase family 2 protein [Maribacter sp. BPC-D8]|uniref:glycosyltransferase family 2 protein n=1 Tax=Maribacter sp. BPC-D8 TaxID=3053613 RepID=UPI002B48EE79|nr:glycosyltransferase family 2 protein [Maribacter sp. BPC-D8]WRI28710.1 glycosyltransferase family 2 protein [Maribacter sp. BPC-D8]
MNNLVSIITPVYNSQMFLDDCMNSVIAQTYEKWEHIFVDDCSSDNSAKIIEEYAQKDSRIKFHRLSINSGAGTARNKAIELAQGDYIAFLDSDDTWYPQKLQLQINFMKVNNYYFTFTTYDKIDEVGNNLNIIIKSKRVVDYHSALYKNPIGCLTVMYDVNYFGKQYMPSIRKRQDYALWLNLLKKTKGYGLSECLSSYRVGKESISSNKLKLLKYEWQIYRDVEGLSIFKSAFYTVSAIVLKLKSYF